MSEPTVVTAFPERHLSRLMKVNLTRQGYAVHSTASSSAVIEAMESLPRIEVFILDSALKAPDTRELIGLIRAHKRHQNARIAVCGSKDGDDFNDTDIFLPNPTIDLRDIFRGGPPPAFA